MSYVLQDTYYVLGNKQKIALIVNHFLQNIFFGAVLDSRFKKCWIAATSMSEHALLNSVRFELTSRYSKLKDDESESHRNSTNEEQQSTNQESGPT